MKWYLLIASLSIAAVAVAATPDQSKTKQYQDRKAQLKAAESPPVARITVPDEDPAVSGMRAAAKRAPPPVSRYTPPPEPESDLRFLEIPAVVEIEPDEWFVIRPRTNYPFVTYIAADKGLKIFPPGELKNEMNTVVEGRVLGDYRVAAIAADGDKPTDPLWFIVRVGHAPQPPPGPGPGPGPVPPGPGPQPPPPAPIVKAEKLFVFTIDNAETRTAARVRFLNDPYWYQLKSKGHAFEKYNTTRTDVMANCAAELAMNGGSGTPIIIIRDAATNKWLNKDPADLKLPVDAASFKALIARYTDAVP